MDSDFIALLIDTVIVEHWIRADEYSKPVYGEPTSYRCRIENTIRNVLNTQGQVVVSSATIYFNTDAVIMQNDRITLPDQRTPVIVRIDQQSDERGPYYIEVNMA